MAQMVTIEGSTTPSSELPRGQRRTVVYTDRVKDLVKKGFIVVVGEMREIEQAVESTTELAPLPEANQAPEPPGPHVGEATGEPNVGTEVPNDGQWHELNVPAVPQAPDETAQHNLAAEAAESALHEKQTVKHSPWGSG